MGVLSFIFLLKNVNREIFSWQPDVEEVFISICMIMKSFWLSAYHWQPTRTQMLRVYESS